MTDLEAQVRKLVVEQMRTWPVMPDGGTLLQCLDRLVREAMRLQRERDAEIVKEWWNLYYGDAEGFGFGRLADAIRDRRRGDETLYSQAA